VSYSAQILSDTAHENALAYEYLVHVVPNSEQVCLEFFFDDLEEPNFIVMNGNLLKSSPVLNKTGTLQIWGDDGPLYIQADWKPLFSRKWRLPESILTELTQDYIRLDEVIKNLMTI
jgi:hypothetical protein